MFEISAAAEVLVLGVFSKAKSLWGAYVADGEPVVLPKIKSMRTFGDQDVSQTDSSESQ